MIDNSFRVDQHHEEMRKQEQDKNEIRSVLGTKAAETDLPLMETLDPNVNERKICKSW